jgi:hypothetical protein
LYIFLVENVARHRVDVRIPRSTPDSDHDWIPSSCEVTRNWRRRYPPSAQHGSVRRTQMYFPCFPLAERIKEFAINASLLAIRGIGNARKVSPGVWTNSCVAKHFVDSQEQNLEGVAGVLPGILAHCNYGCDDINRLLTLRHWCIFACARALASADWTLKWDC